MEIFFLFKWYIHQFLPILFFFLFSLYFIIHFLFATLTVLCWMTLNLLDLLWYSLFKVCICHRESSESLMCVFNLFWKKITPLLVIFLSLFFFEEINFLNDLMLISDQISYRGQKKKSWFNHFNLFCYLIIFSLWIYNLPSRPHALLFIIIMGGFVSFFFFF